MSDRYVLVSGCSGGGKSWLLAELRGRGFSVVVEPGRRIVQAELQDGGRALPWIDPAAFARRAMEVSIEDRKAAAAMPGRVFFDRGLVDAVAALEHATGEPAIEVLGAWRRYNRTVFLAPPWPDIYIADAERRHGFDEAVAEYERLQQAYSRLGYRLVVLPLTDVKARADLVLATLTDAPT